MTENVSGGTKIGWKNSGPTKMGWLTSEFAFGLLAVLVSYLATQDIGEGTFSKVIATIAIVLASLGYSASRAVVKREQIRGLNALLEKKDA
jgi:hypothetical protein